MNFIVPANHCVKLYENKNIDNYLNFARGLKKSVEHEDDENTNCSCCTWNGPQMPGKKTGWS